MSWLKKMLPGLRSNLFLTAVGRTETGPTREKNEDGFGLWDGAEGHGSENVLPAKPQSRVDTKKPVLVMVADGMGGHGEGKATSEMALRVVSEQILNQKNALETDSFPSWWPRVSAKAVEQAWLAIREKFEPKNLMTGTTLSGLYFYQDYVGLVHLGDSAIYRYRKGKLTTESECQSYVGRLLREGKISPEQARLHPKRNIVEMALTSDPNLIPKPQITVLDVKPGDRWILATDGLTDGLSDERIADLLQKTENQPTKEVLDRLIDQSLEHSGRDNTTAIVADMSTNVG